VHFRNYPISRFQGFSPNNVDVWCSFFFAGSVDRAIGAVKRGGRSMVRLSLRLLPWRRLTFSHGVLVRNPQDFRNLDGFYHTPRIGRNASEL